MKLKLFVVLICCMALSACNNEKKIPNTDIEVARVFIKDILENNFKEAETFILKEETNQQYFDLFKKEFESNYIWPALLSYFNLIAGDISKIAFSSYLPSLM